MKPKPRHSAAQNPLRSKGRQPIPWLRFMQIDGISHSLPVAYTKPASSPQGSPAAGDRVSISTSGDSFSDLVSQVSQMPEVRSEVVDAYKVRIQAGYPGPLDVEGLANLMGPTWTRLAGTASSE